MGGLSGGTDGFVQGFLRGGIMQIKVISADTERELEREINKYITVYEYSGKRILDIKFGGMHRVSHREPYWTAMIIVE